MGPDNNDTKCHLMVKDAPQASVSTQTVKGCGQNGQLKTKPMTETTAVNQHGQHQTSSQISKHMVRYLISQVSKLDIQISIITILYGHTFPGSVEPRLMVSIVEYTLLLFTHTQIQFIHTYTNILIRKRGSVRTHLLYQLFLKVYL